MNWWVISISHENPPQTLHIVSSRKKWILNHVVLNHYSGLKIAVLTFPQIYISKFHTVQNNDHLIVSFKSCYFNFYLDLKYMQKPMCSVKDKIWIKKTSYSLPLRLPAQSARWTSLLQGARILWTLTNSEKWIHIRGH